MSRRPRTSASISPEVLARAGIVAPVARATRTDPEHQEQKALMDWAQLNAWEHDGLELIFAIPNGGDRHPVVAAKLKAEGVKPGVPDICLPVPRNGYHGLYLELKAGSNTPRANQREWLEALWAQGYYATWAQGWVAASQIILEYLNGQFTRV